MLQKGNAKSYFPSFDAESCVMKLPSAASCMEQRRNASSETAEYKKGTLLQKTSSRVQTPLRGKEQRTHTFCSSAKGAAAPPKVEEAASVASHWHVIVATSTHPVPPLGPFRAAAAEAARKRRRAQGLTDASRHWVNLCLLVEALQQGMSFQNIEVSQAGAGSSESTVARRQMYSPAAAAWVVLAESSPLLVEARSRQGRFHKGASAASRISTEAESYASSSQTPQSMLRPRMSLETKRLRRLASKVSNSATTLTTAEEGEEAGGQVKKADTSRKRGEEDKASGEEPDRELVVSKTRSEDKSSAAARGGPLQRRKRIRKDRKRILVTAVTRGTILFCIIVGFSAIAITKIAEHAAVLHGIYKDVVRSTTFLENSVFREAVLSLFSDDARRRLLILSFGAALLGHKLLLQLIVVFLAVCACGVFLGVAGLSGTIALTKFLLTG